MGARRPEIKHEDYRAKHRCDDVDGDQHTMVFEEIITWLREQRGREPTLGEHEGNEALRGQEDEEIDSQKLAAEERGLWHL